MGGASGQPRLLCPLLTSAFSFQSEGRGLGQPPHTCVSVRFRAANAICGEFLFFFLLSNVGSLSREFLQPVMSPPVLLLFCRLLMGPDRVRGVNGVN